MGGEPSGENEPVVDAKVAWSKPNSAMAAGKSEKVRRATPSVPAR